MKPIYKKCRGVVFFLIGGVQPKTVALEGAGRLCPSCGLNTCQQMRLDYYLSLFFIPLFPVKRGAPYWQCSRCGQACGGQPPAQPAPRPEPAPAAALACGFCGGELRQGFRYCPYCGARIPRLPAARVEP